MADADFTNDTIEKILLKKIYTDVNYTALFQDVFDERWCENKSIAVLCKMILAFYRQYNRLPTQKVVSALLQKYAEKHVTLNHGEILKELIEVSAFDLGVSEECYKSNLHRFINNRGLYFAIFDNINDIEKNKSIDKCLKRFEAVQGISFNNDLGMDYFTDIDTHWNYILNPEARLSIGYDSLDRITNGGFLKDGKSLYIFMGQPGLGKSCVLSNLAYNFLKQNKTVVVISLEMSQDVYATRFDAHISDDNINRLKYSNVTSKSKIEQFYEDHPHARLFIKEYPPRTVRPSDIELYIDKLISSGVKPDVIIVDYLNLVIPQSRELANSGNSYAMVLAVAEKLRALSYKYEVPVISATQSNSEGFNNENIGMEHVSESKGIAHTTDFLAALYQIGDDQDNGIINMKILKNRLGGQVGKVLNFKLDPDTLTLNDISITSMSGDPNTSSQSESTQILDNIDDIASSLEEL